MSKGYLKTATSGIVVILSSLILVACANSPTTDKAEQEYEAHETQTGSMLARRPKQTTTPEEAAALQDELRRAATNQGAARMNTGKGSM